MLRGPERYKVAYGGRGAGKTWSIAQELVLQSMQQRHRILCAREVQLSIRDSSKRTIEDMIERLGVTDQFDIREAYIRNSRTGSTFIFSGLQDRGTKLKSYEGITRVWVAEAQSVSQDSMDALHPTIRAPGSEIWYDFNPYQESDPVYQMFVANEPPPNSAVCKVNYYDNPWFPDVLREQMQWDQGRDPDKYRHVWEGEPVQHTAAQVFSGVWSIAPVPEPPEGTVFYHGTDWGFACDPTTLVRCWLEQKKLYIDRALFAYRVETQHLPDMFKRVNTAKSWPIVADSARPETISHMRRNGFPNMRKSKKGKGSVIEGIEFLRNFDIIIDPRCKELIDEFALYCYKIDKKTGLILPEIVDKNNHGIDAIRYAVEPLMRGAPKIRVKSKR